MDVLEWIERVLHPDPTTSVGFLYDSMDSQSEYSLPVIYQPFDAGRRSHWRDRGALFDYLSSTHGRGKRLLDFGPGDGWPSLIIAPSVGEVIGVDGSSRRVEVCGENATRLGISNAHFYHVVPGEPLPFPSDSFDGAMAATSIEQTPDPRSALREIWRVLRPGARLRISYEALGTYLDGREKEAGLMELAKERCRLYLYDRQIESEKVRHFSITFARSRQTMLEHFCHGKESCLSFDMITIPALAARRSDIVGSQTCILTQPSGNTLASWLLAIGFSEVLPTYSGSWFAGQLFDQFSEETRPTDLGGVDALICPVADIVVRMAAPLDSDPMITAIK
jgi:SAM-dependent methyltransferase